MRCSNCRLKGTITVILKDKETGKQEAYDHKFEGTEEELLEEFSRLREAAGESGKLSMHMELEED